jgi:putative toxin-antitoxin system antitoxin component (TIGR02293 family)
MGAETVRVTGRKSEGRTQRRTAGSARVTSLPLVYRRSLGVDAYARAVWDAEPMVLLDIERRGVESEFFKDLAKRLDIPASRLYEMWNLPKATAERKVASGANLDGQAGQAVLGFARLLGLAQEIVAQSTAPEAKSFDTAKWLGQWIERPQPALGGRRPSEFLDTPTGISMVERLLGAIRSGSYL